MLIIYVSFGCSLLLPIVLGHLAEKYNWFGFTENWPIWAKVVGYTFVFSLAAFVLFPTFWTQEFEGIAGNEDRIESAARIVISILLLAGYISLGIKNKWMDAFDKISRGKRVLIVLSVTGLIWIAAIVYTSFML